MPQGGQDRPVAQFGSGESFAEAVAATLKHTPVNIRALESTSILCIPAKQLESCTSPHAFLLRENLSTEMSKKIGVLTQTLSVVGEPRLSDRIMAYLRTLPQDADGRVEVPMNRQEWATYLRAADKSLIRELSTLQKEGILEVDGRFIRVL
ncbi:Crp/Fnr family transcriptional regulator [uncultured Senegalimassilia sp.]|uniref:Crp/Fnr family transcriptional regulator n=1 Tax=uncultured Senegalimassilia sp. TaxID=1714350 RepID=UPI0025FCD546|nr:Crp/Fnr family transcriptional regulator [uncultured Senegalimassilia sp.]